MSSVPDSSAPTATAHGDFTLLLQAANRGDAQAADRILPLVYDELRRLAAAKLAREVPGQTLQPTALVHEAWLRLGGERQPDWQNQAHFFAAAAEAMRRILVDNARRRKAVRRGGAMQKISANQTGFDVPAPELDDDAIIMLDEALARLAAKDIRKAEIVKLCYIVGLTFEEAAAALGVSDRTAKRDWVYARAWLFNELKALRATE